MRLPTDKHLASIAEYLRYENSSLNKHEYRNGEIVAMAGGSANHSRIASNLIREIGNALKGKACEVFESNFRISIPRSARFTYADLWIACGNPIIDSRDTTNQTATNPRVIIEILSPSTEAYDRGEKFTNYRLIDSLEEYVLVSQDMPRAEIFRRQSDANWMFTAVSGVESTLRLLSIHVEVPFSDIYSHVEFSPPLAPE